MGVAIGFGLWWIVFPDSVVRFYTWFHGGKVALPRRTGVRAAGMFWVLLVLLAVFMNLRGQ